MKTKENVLKIWFLMTEQVEQFQETLLTNCKYKVRRTKDCGIKGKVHLQLK